MLQPTDIIDMFFFSFYISCKRECSASNPFFFRFWDRRLSDYVFQSSKREKLFKPHPLSFFIFSWTLSVYDIMLYDTGRAVDYVQVMLLLVPLLKAALWSTSQRNVEENLNLITVERQTLPRNRTNTINELFSYFPVYLNVLLRLCWKSKNNKRKRFMIMFPCCYRQFLIGFHMVWVRFGRWSIRISLRFVLFTWMFFSYMWIRHHLKSVVNKILCVNWSNENINCDLDESFVKK